MVGLGLGGCLNCDFFDLFDGCDFYRFGGRQGGALSLRAVFFFLFFLLGSGPDRSGMRRAVVPMKQGVQVADV